jgi:hypothetical protein
MKKIVSLISMFALASALSVPVLAQETGAPGGKMERGEKNERHPEIRHAIKSLEKARDYMQHAAHDFGGHREAALRACDDAIAQLKQALQYDKK